jgi:hypothetical protein
MVYQALNRANFRGLAQTPMCGVWDVRQGHARSAELFQGTDHYHSCPAWRDRRLPKEPVNSSMDRETRFTQSRKARKVRKENQELILRASLRLGALA